MLADVARSLGTDYYLIDELLTEEEREIRDRVRAFADREVIPIINDYWERAEFPFELVPKIADLNIAGGTIEGYECPGMSEVASGLVAVELARGDGSINTFYGVHSGLAMGTIAMLGSEEQKERWLPPMARMEKLGAFGLTEPNHGSDAVMLETTARREGDEYVIDGEKRWIGNASFADVIIIWARDDDGDVGGFLVEKGTPGYSAEVIKGKTSKRCVWQADVKLEGVRIPAANRLGDARTFKDTAKVLTATRYGVAWEAIGHAVASYEAALTYAKERVQFGKPIANFQLIQSKLAGHAGRDHQHAAHVPPPQPAPAGRQDDRRHGLPGQDEQREKSASGLLRRARHPRRERDSPRVPRRPAHRRHRGRLHLRGHRYRAGAHSGARDHGLERFRLGSRF